MPTAQPACDSATSRLHEPATTVPPATLCLRFQCPHSIGVHDSLPSLQPLSLPSQPLSLSACHRSLSACHLSLSACHLSPPTRGVPSQSPPHASQKATSQTLNDQGRRRPSPQHGCPVSTAQVVQAALACTPTTSSAHAALLLHAAPKASAHANATRCQHHRVARRTSPTH